MENLERTRFKCQTCGIECSNEMKAQYGSLYDGRPYTWDECTTCAMKCDDCGEPLERDSAATIGHSKHLTCWAMYCSRQKEWVKECSHCEECLTCDHCPHCELCWFECTCYTP